MDEARKKIAGCMIALVIVALIGCQSPPPPYGREAQLSFAAPRRQVWAVAPAVNLSGQSGVDPLLQADIVYGQLQQVRGITAIPVNRVAEIYSSLHLEKIQSADQAALVCDLLGCDALLVPTVTLYDPYDPPKLGASLQLFRKPSGYDRSQAPNPRELSRQATPGDSESLPPPSGGRDFRQAVGMFDASNGSTRDALNFYASGRNDPTGPLGAKAYRVDMDRFCGFAYFSLIRKLNDQSN
jgi:hypothetical protein